MTELSLNRLLELLRNESGAKIGVAELQGLEPDTLQGLDLRGARLRGADLSGWDLRGTNLCDAILSDADLSGADLRGALMARAKLWGTRLSGTNLTGATLRGASISADLSGARLDDLDLRGAKFWELPGRPRVIIDRQTRWHGARPPGAILLEDNADLSGADLSGLTLRGLALQGVVLRGADLSGIRLLRSSLRGCDLSGANLSGASIRRLDLRGTDLRSANLSGADLTFARLDGTDLSDAILSGAGLPAPFAARTVPGHADPRARLRALRADPRSAIRRPIGRYHFHHGERHIGLIGLLSHSRWALAWQDIGPLLPLLTSEEVEKLPGDTPFRSILLAVTRMQQQTDPAQAATLLLDGAERRWWRHLLARVVPEAIREETRQHLPPPEDNYTAYALHWGLDRPLRGSQDTAQRQRVPPRAPRLPRGVRDRSALFDFLLTHPEVQPDPFLRMLGRHPELALPTARSALTRLSNRRSWLAMKLVAATGPACAPLRDDILHHLHHSPHRLQWAAAMALGVLDDPSVLSDLAAASQTRHLRLRGATVRAMITLLCAHPEV